jgi:hypothetical protein
LEAIVVTLIANSHGFEALSFQSTEGVRRPDLPYAIIGSDFFGLNWKFQIQVDYLTSLPDPSFEELQVQGDSAKE